MSNSAPPQIPLDSATSLALTEAAHQARLVAHVLAAAGPPRPGSKFETLNKLTTPERTDRRVANYLAAASEHLLFWADAFAPLLFDSEQTTQVTLRPTHTLARAAIEATSQAVWVLNSTDPAEAVRRNFAMVGWELARRHLSETDPQERARAAAARNSFREAARELRLSDQLETPGGYLAFVKSVASVNGSQHTELELERLWRESSGVAHGHLWVNDVLNETLPHPDGNGFVRVPDQKQLVETITAASQIFTLGVLNYLDYLGADIQQALETSRQWLAEVIPLTDESARDALRGVRT